MKGQINWKLFAILLAASIASAILVLPYALSLSSEALKASPLPMEAIAAISIIQSSVLFAIFIFAGLKLSQKAGLGLPILENWLDGKPVKAPLSAILPISIALGVAAGVAIVALDAVFFYLGSPISLGQAEPPIWQGFLASFYGGIGEEVMMRLFLMTALVWAFSKFQKTADGKPASAMVWLAIIIASVLFGLGHLPVTAAMTAVTPLILARALLLNGIGGMVFGWLYWKRGLESAIIAHFSADIVLHVLVPALSLAWLFG